ncbi:MarR family winged helix-turn-helix transcriptional regulator, partial [Acinetobacter baumannii]|uniref:MarR family winged helix-turn-helix transcriptional regulator n=1 Tax=Acinetobacter baumannii TaxID=470 RepID=UPI0013D250B9
FEKMGAKAIGTHSSMHKTKVSRAVRALDERRWLSRHESDLDRREEILTLTPLGRRAYTDLVPRALAFEQRILAALGPEAEKLIASLDKL